MKTGPKIGHKQSAQTVARRILTRWGPPCSTLERLQRRTVVAPRDDDLGDCWIWTGAVTPKGYGVIRVNGKVEYTHRVGHRERFGDIPDGLEIDHLCSVRRCWRHTEPVTGPENMRRWREKQYAATT